MCGLLYTIYHPHGNGAPHGGHVAPGVGNVCLVDTTPPTTHATKTNSTMTMAHKQIKRSQ